MRDKFKVNVLVLQYPKKYNIAADNPTPTCSKPTIENGSVSPSNATIEGGNFYDVSCNDGYTLHGNATIECSEAGTLSLIPTCTGIVYYPNLYGYSVYTNILIIYNHLI